MSRHLVVGACVGALAGLLVYARRPGGKDGFRSGQPTVFVSIASYRDADCSNTLRSIFENAKDPSRVFVGVCEQNASDDQTCVPKAFEWHDQVRRVAIPSKEALGPTYARYLCTTLYRGETFFCQMDSHMRCTRDWEQRAIDMLAKCPSKKPVLTHYPHDIEDEAANFSATQAVPVLCKSKFNDEGVPTFEAVTLAASETPRPVPFTAGGFVFGPGAMLRDAPYDPDLPFLFQGEEILYSARLWTNGYDFYTPTQNLVFHRYYRNKSPKFWNDLGYAEIQKKTMVKVRSLLRGRMPRYSHGMGSARSLDEYWSFAGLDWGAKSSSSVTKFCGTAEGGGGTEEGGGGTTG